MARKAANAAPDAADAEILGATAGSSSEGDGELEFEIGPDAEFIEPKRDLRRKAKEIKLKPGEQEPVAAAEAALARMASSFDGWMAEETQRLAELWSEADRSGYEGEVREAFHRAAHDIKGQAATLGFPLAGRIAASLCRLLDGSVGGERMPHELVRQHVQSVRAIIAEQAREDTSDVARLLAERLDEVTTDYLDQITAA
ncbi:MAG: Hpt domain-containing protein [Siculibacillus sp.]